MSVCMLVVNTRGGGGQEEMGDNDRHSRSSSTWKQDAALCSVCVVDQSGLLQYVTYFEQSTQSDSFT